MYVGCQSIVVYLVVWVGNIALANTFPVNVVSELNLQPQRLKRDALLFVNLRNCTFDVQSNHLRSSIHHLQQNMDGPDSSPVHLAV